MISRERDIVNCNVCGDAVTNPICKDCLSAQMKSWFKIKKFDQKIIDNASVIFDDLPAISECVKCGNEMTVCRHCFTKEVYNIFSEKYSEYKEEFTRLFNYEIYEDW